MGEYIKNPKIEGEEIKIALCRGKEKENWEIFFSKEMLILLNEKGFISWYAGDFEEINDLPMYIELYDELNTKYIYNLWRIFNKVDVEYIGKDENGEKQFKKLYLLSLNMVMKLNYHMKKLLSL